MNKFLIVLSAFCLFVGKEYTLCADSPQSVSSALSEIQSNPASDESAPIRGTTVGTNLLYVTGGGALVVGAIAAALLVSSNHDGQTAYSQGIAQIK